MGLIKEIAGAALAPVTGGASLAMTQGSGRKKRTGSVNTDDPGAPGQDFSSDADLSNDPSYARKFGSALLKRFVDKRS